MSAAQAAARPEAVPGWSAALAGLEERLFARPPWTRRLIFVALGALAALALPPFHLLPALIPLFTVAIWAIGRASSFRSAFAAGWWLGFGFFIAGFYWIAEAFLVDAARFGWLIAPAIGGLAAYMAIYVGLALAATRALPLVGIGRVLGFAALWVIGEWLRGLLFTGFPWNPIGSIWVAFLPVAQFAANFGVWGLSLIAVALFAAPALLTAPAGPRRGLAYGGAMLILIGAIAFGGWLRLGSAPTAAAEAAPVLRLVQPSIPQSLKNDRLKRQANLDLLIELSRSSGWEQVDHVIWPEAAVGWLIERTQGLPEALSRVAPPGGYLLTGAPRAEPVAGDIERLYNSLAAIDEAGRILAHADKFHLVPLGEYVPLRNLLPFLEKITPGGIDFTAAQGPQTLRLDGLPPFGTLICYEVIFAGAVAAPEDRPDWLLNLTNDGWFGSSTGPYQHFAAARLRAIEEGLPLIRVANNGITGAVDPFGRVLARLPRDSVAVLDVALPAPAPAGLFARFGVGASLGLIMFNLVIAIAYRRG